MLNEAGHYFYNDFVDIWRQGPLTYDSNQVVKQPAWSLVGTGISCDHQSATVRFLQAPALGPTEVQAQEALDSFFFDYAQDVRAEDILVKRTPSARDFGRAFKLTASEKARQEGAAHYVRLRGSLTEMPASIATSYP